MSGKNKTSTREVRLMNIFEFMSDSPWLSFFLGCMLAQVIIYIFFTLPNRFIRHLNIRAKGWPPSHCDADGDFKGVKSKRDILDND